MPTRAGTFRQQQPDERHQARTSSDTAIGTLTQPNDVASHASTGRNTSWPLALLAVSMPTTRPRRATNQRLAMVAATPKPVAPAPRPTSTPQVR